MSITISGIPVTIATGPEGDDHGLRESWPEGQPARITIHWKCDFSQRYTLIQALRGGYFGGVLNLPHACPYSPNLTCVGIGELAYIKPRVDADGLLTFASAIIPTEYGIPSYDLLASSPGDSQKDPSGQAFTKTKFRASVEVFSPPSGAYFWESGPEAAKKVKDSQLGFVRPRAEISLTRLCLPAMPLDAAMRFLGSVNAAPVAIADTVYPRGTLLFASAGGNDNDDEPSWSIGGKTFEVEYSFVGNGDVDDGTGTDTFFRPEWNHFLATDGHWRHINTKSDGTGSRPYRYVDFWSALP